MNRDSPIIPFVTTFVVLVSCTIGAACSWAVITHQRLNAVEAAIESSDRCRPKLPMLRKPGQLGQVGTVGEDASK